MAGLSYAFNVAYGIGKAAVSLTLFRLFLIVTEFSYERTHQAYALGELLHALMV
jgi:hypothetical protein